MFIYRIIISNPLIMGTITILTHYKNLKVHTVRE